MLTLHFDLVVYVPNFGDVSGFYTVALRGPKTQVYFTKHNSSEISDNYENKDISVKV